MSFYICFILCFSLLCPHRTVRRLLLTSKRLCEVAASTTLAAGDKLAIKHFIVSGVTAAISQNRPVSSSLFSSFLLFFIQAEE
jgi:hypothetical protein